MVSIEPPRLRLATMRRGSSGFATWAWTATKAARRSAGEHEGDHHRGRVPAVGPGLTEAVDEGHQPAAPEDHPGDVEADPGVAVAGGGWPPRPPTATTAAIGQVDVEAPPPVEVLGQEPAEDEAEGRAADGDRRVDAEGPPPLAGVGEGGGEDGEHRRRQERAEAALQRPGADRA